METDSLLEELELEKVTPSIIMVAGVGGAGGNAINRMHDLGIGDVSFMVCNTDRQALDMSPPMSIKIQLGEGLGAGNNPEKGKAAAIESLDSIVDVFNREGIKMIFITAGMGGGTGTGAAPIIAKAAKEAGILTVGIVTMPYKDEGSKRVKNARIGVEELKKGVDSLIIINNENIADIYGELTINEAFGKANDVLATAARGIAEIVTRTIYPINIDFADVCAVMRDSGISLMGTGKAVGDNRARESIEQALFSPLLNHNSIAGAKDMLLYIAYGKTEATLIEIGLIRRYITDMAGGDVNIIWGAGSTELLNDELEVTIIATGFKSIDEETIGSTYSDSSSVSRGGLNSLGGAWIPPRSDLGRPFVKPSSQIRRDIGDLHSQNDSIKFTDDRKRYMDIETKLNSPAYVRRKVKVVAALDNQELNKPVARGGRRAVDLSDNIQQDVDASETVSLFDKL